jgi:hypothetical protein
MIPMPKRRQEMVKIQFSKKAIAMACVFALALAVVAISSVPARTQGTPEEQAPRLTKHVLNATYYDANANVVEALCSFAGCQATPVFVFNESIACPGPAGTKCTYEVNIAATASVGPVGDSGLFQFLVDGATPTGGQTDSQGLYTFESFGPTGNYNSAYTVTSQVKNTGANQSHSIGVLVSCQDIQVLGNCVAATSIASLTIRVMKP